MSEENASISYMVELEYISKWNPSCKDLNKKKAREMSLSGNVSRTFEFLRVFGAAEKIQAKV